MKKTMIALTLLGLALGSACGGAKAVSTQRSIMVATHAEAQAALGHVVQVRGVVQHEKLGDTVNVGDLSVRCVDFQFTEVGATVTAEGMLEIMDDEPAAVSESGAMAQGTATGGSTFVIRNCVVR